MRDPLLSVYEVTSAYFYRKKVDILDYGSDMLHQRNDPTLSLLMDATYSDISPPNHVDGFQVVHYDGHARLQYDEDNSLYAMIPSVDFSLWWYIRTADLGG